MFIKERLVKDKMVYTEHIPQDRGGMFSEISTEPRTFTFVSKFVSLKGLVAV